VNALINEYMAQGYTLTLRQAYYQLVARDILPNTQRSYKQLGDTISDGRLAGLIDWESIEDRTRNMQCNAHWDSPGEIVLSCAQQFKMDLWEDQDYYCEVWVEKDALIGVLEGVCTELDVPYFACRGYTSQSEMWRAAQRLSAHEDAGRQTIIFHLGDHDPSGIDMTRDIQSRLNMFLSDTEVQRIALNMDQVEKYNPPPNPAKTSDTRFESYAREFGDESWELDALEPRVIVDLIREHVGSLINQDRRDALLEEQTKARVSLHKIAQNWSDIIVGLEGDDENKVS